MKQRTPGAYHLILRVHRRVALRVGRLGAVSFPAGWYVYTGSAMGGVEARVARHRRRQKPLHWHIDYLLGAAELVDVVVVPARRRLECERNRIVLSLPGARVGAPRFGSGDCRCPSHLAYFGLTRPQIPAP